MLLFLAGDGNASDRPPIFTVSWNIVGVEATSLPRLGSLTVAFGLVIVAFAGAVTADGVEDPTGTACVNATGDTECEAAAASGTGNATATSSPGMAASGTGNATHEQFYGAAVSGAGDAEGCVAVSGTGKATNTCFAWIPVGGETIVVRPGVSGCETVQDHAGSDAACHDVDPEALLP